MQIKALALLVLSFLTFSANAANRYWDGNEFFCFDAFSSTNCWSSNDVPDPDDNAFFTASDEGTVNFNGGNFTNLNAGVIGGNYTWDMNGGAYNITDQFDVQNGGALTIRDGGIVNAGLTNADGNLTVYSGSRLNAGSFLQVSSGSQFINSGITTADEFLVYSGALANSASGYVGSGIHNNGAISAIDSAIVRGADSKWLTNLLLVTNNKTLTIDSGGLVDVDGNVDITSNGRIYTSKGGRLEADTLTLTSGGDLYSSSATVGTSFSASGSANSLGNATVTGSGSQWDTASMIVTKNGVLSVDSGGYVDVNGLLTISSGGQADTTGGGRIEANTLTLTSGGELYSSSANVGVTSSLDGSANSIGNATVTGSGSQWDTASMLVTNNGVLSANSAATVDVNGLLTISSGGQADTTGGGRIEANTLRLTSGGDLYSSSANVGATSLLNGSANSLGNASVTGSGSEWDTLSMTVNEGSFIDVRDSGYVDVNGLMTINGGLAFTNSGGRIDANTLTLVNGGALQSSSATVGTSFSASGSANSLGKATVTGSDSRWSTESMVVTKNGVLSAQSAGFVDVNGLLTLSSGGQADTTGAGRIDANTLMLTGGGKLHSRSATVGTTGSSLSGSTNSLGTATVTGSGSQWDTASMIVTANRSLSVNSAGTVDVNGLLAISNGAQVYTTGGGRIEANTLALTGGGDLWSSSANVGVNSSLNGSANSLGSASVSGSGSKWNSESMLVTNFSALSVKDYGTVDVNGLLAISNGGLVDATGGGVIDANTNGSGRIEANTLMLNSGGKLWSKIANVGVASSLDGSANSLGNATVTGSGSQWDTASMLVVNDVSLSVKSAGRVRVRGLMTISSGGQADTTDGGRIDANTLTLASGGKLSSSSAYVGTAGLFNRSANSQGNATVSGAGSSWQSSSMRVTSNATLSVNSGATVLVNNILSVDGNANLQVAKATVTATTVDIIGGSSAMDMTDATIQADVDVTNARLTGTGTITGDLTLVGADIRPGNSPGFLNVGGDFIFDANSAITYELAGTTAVTQYDVLNVAGSAYLAGELVVDWFDNGSGLFDAGAGDFFDILSAESIVDRFDILTLAMLGDGLEWDIDYLIDFDGSKDVLRLSVFETSQVPVPAAAWLFGSALISLAGIKRRKKTSKRVLAS
jgi:T5SS/PEP-CTERM-associated repeat protein